MITKADLLLADLEAKIAVYVMKKKRDKVSNSFLKNCLTRNHQSGN
jgi:hypothetical protein